jgi:rubrerythrin
MTIESKEQAGTKEVKYLCTSCGHQVLQDACAVCIEKCPVCGGPMHPEHVPHKPQ